MSNAEVWEINQGKRLLKRMHKCGVRPGAEYGFLLQALKNAAAVVALDQAKGHGASPEGATASAVAAMQRIKVADISGHPGRDLYALLVANGASPGRCKAELDKVLFLSGHSIEAPSNMVPSQMFLEPVEASADGLVVLAVDEAQYIDQETLDRFPQHSIPRENY